MLSKRDSLKNSGKLRRKKRLKTFAVFLMVFLFVFDFLAAISQLDKFLIKKIVVSGNSTLGANIVGDAILRNLTGRYLWLFPKNNFFIYSKDKIIDSLHNNFVKIKEVGLSLENDALVALVSEREAAFVWCEDGDARCYYADDNGFIFDVAPKLSNGLFLKFNGGMPSGKGSAYYIGKKIMPSDKLRMIDIFRRRIESQIFKNFSEKWYITTVSLKDYEDIFLTFEGVAGKSWELMISPRNEDTYYSAGASLDGGIMRRDQESKWLGFDSDLQNAESNFGIVLSSQAFKEAAKKDGYSLKNLQYIDLRFGRKVFYKFN